MVNRGDGLTNSSLYRSSFAAAAEIYIKQQTEYEMMAIIDV
jgi:hypothetical protein